MKKLICAVLALVLLMSFVSCGKKDMSGTYTEAKEKTNALSSYDITMETIMKFSSGDKVYGTDSEIEMKLDRRNEASPVYSKEYEITDLYSKFTYNSSEYYESGVLYSLSADGQKYKYATTAESVTSSFSSVALDVPEGAFKSAQVKDEEVIAKVDGKDYSDFLSTFINGTSMYFEPVNQDKSFSYKFSDAVLSFELEDNGYLEYTALKYSAEFAHKGGNATVDVFLKMSFDDPGESVSVDAPKDLASYEWYEEEELSDEEWEEQKMKDVMGLFDENNQRVKNFDELYAIYCAKYGKDAVDLIVDSMELLNSLKK